MTKDKWEDIKELVKDKFEIESQEVFDLEDIPNGMVEVIIFDGPIGRMKLEFSTKPLVLSTKAMGSRRIGSEKKIEYNVSDTEMTYTFKAFRDEGDDNWQELAAGDSFLTD